MFFKSIWYAIPAVTLSLFAVRTLLSAARISVWSLESMHFHFLGILFIRPCQLKINELFSEYFPEHRDKVKVTHYDQRCLEL